MEISLKEIPLFNNLPDNTLAEIKRALQTRQLKAGEVLFNQGDPGDELILVKEGEISIYAPIEGSKGNERPIRVFKPGEMLGEMAIIDEQPRSLSARAKAASTILTLEQNQFKELLSENPEMGFAVMAGLNDRIRYTTDFLSEVREWVQRIASGSYQSSELAEESDKYEDETLSTLAAEFAQMAAQVQEREEELRKEVLELRIAIDESKRKEDVEEILDSEFYRDLKAKAKKMKKRKKG
jgi:CRP-like cAMP-binding protein